MSVLLVAIALVLLFLMKMASRPLESEIRQSRWFSEEMPEKGDLWNCN